jgi:hypothetical protein
MEVFLNTTIMGILVNNIEKITANILRIIHKSTTCDACSEII